MQKIFIFLIVAISLFNFAELFAEFKIDAQVRPRSEFRNGFKTIIPEGKDPAFFTEQRTRLIADYVTQKLQIHIAMQDVRMWGAANQIYKADPSLNNVYEAWAQYNFTNQFGFRVGRQALDYDNARFLGNLNWAAQGRSHDAILFLYKNDEKKLKIDLGAAFNQNGFEPTKLSSTFYSGVSNYKTMQFIHANKKFDKTNLSLLFQNDGRQLMDSTTAFRQTAGIFVKHDRNKVAFGGELFWQGGVNQTDTDISAFMVNAYATYKTKVTPITLGVDYLSGTSFTDDKDHSFAPLYGTNHKFYGFMDYFYVGNFHGQAATPSGLIDIHLKTKFKFNNSNFLTANVHYFMSEADIFEESNGVINTDNKADSYLGTEIDLVYTLKLLDNVVINLGYSHMLSGETMEFIKPGNIDTDRMNNWAWLQIDFKPTIFESK